jgi:DNA uptake protein ComE-like DNA-binding protein
MKNLVWFLAGIGSAAALAQLASWRRRPTQAAATGLDLNNCSREELLRLPGVRDDVAERILDNRPYRSKFDLLNRLIVTESVYSQLRSRVYVDPAAARQSVQIALAEA